MLGRLPGVGEKTATRYAFALAGDSATARELAEALVHVVTHVRPCEDCGNLTDLDAGATCAICRDPRRNHEMLCIVGKLQELMAFERSQAMRGTYFVLGKLLSPLEGIGPDALRVPAIRGIIERKQVKEIVLAMPASMEGEATALFLKRELQDLEVQFTRIATGVSHGADLEFADAITLGKALEGRRPV
jgi:recombination protein RecR